MSWQATNAVRDHSKARGATLTVGLILASYADPGGGEVRPSLETIEEKAKVARRTAIDARRWFIEQGEAEVEGTHPSGAPILTFAPLIALSRGALTAPQGVHSVHPSSDTPGVHSLHQGGALSSAGSALTAPEREERSGRENHPPNPPQGGSAGSEEMETPWDCSAQPPTPPRRRFLPIPRLPRRAEAVGA